MAQQTRSRGRTKKSASNITKPRKTYERADSQALSDLMAQQYPKLVQGDKEYNKFLGKL
jgi:hypothetical protein